MKLQIEYSNYTLALMSIIGDKRPYCVSNDKKKFAYQIPIENFKKGFDFYELNRTKDGGVFFTIVTMVGFKTICETNSNYHYNDIATISWQNEIFDIVLIHFNKEEYLALKKGYIKKGQSIYHDDKNVIKKVRTEEHLKVETIEVAGLSKTEKFLKSSDDFLKLSLELQQKKNSGCLVVMMVLLALIFTVVNL